MDELQLLDQTLQACLTTAARAGETPSDIAARLACRILIRLAEARKTDNALIIVRQKDGWNSHVHIDYLSADHDHFKSDFEWDKDTKSEDEHDYSNH